ncbi:MAG: NUDIX domain-containing protein [Pseudomonadota bacterium]
MIMAQPLKIQLAVSSIVHHDGQYLLVKRANPPSKDQWAFPGGRVEPEEDIRVAAIRELREETGLHGEIISVFDVHDFPLDPLARHTSRMVLIVFRVAVRDMAPLTASSDAADVGWFTPEDAQLLSMPNSMKIAFNTLKMS